MWRRNERRMEQMNLLPNNESNKVFLAGGRGKPSTVNHRGNQIELKRK